MATARRLPTEVLSHILELSLEDLDSKERQCARIIFNQVSRAFCIASDSTSFYVGSEAQAKALMAKLVREKNWVAQEQGRAPGARTTRAAALGMRVSRVRQLEADILKKKTGTAVLAKLLLANPDLVTLEISLGHKSFEVSTNFPALEGAMEKLASLRDLRLAGIGTADAVFRLLKPVLPRLEVLDLEEINYRGANQVDDRLLQTLAGPKLRVIRATLRGSVPSSAQLLSRLATTSKGQLRVLRLASSGILRFVGMVDEILHLATNLVHFSWDPWIVDGLKQSDCDSAHKLLTGMSSLEHLELSLWTMDVPREAEDEMGSVFDDTLFHTLATLQNLHTVKFSRWSEDNGKAFEQANLIPFVRSLPSLRSMCLITNAHSLNGVSSFIRKGRVLPAVEGGDVTVEWS
ncbi:hypothetical protein P7C70_g6036, partial [Phenoliferia sp. Uapishka_3]